MRLRLRRPSSKNNKDAIMPINAIQENWHLDKSVSAGHILTTAMMIAGFVIWMLSQSDRITVLEVQQTYVDGAITAMSNDLDTIDGKVDKVLIRLGDTPANGS